MVKCLFNCCCFIIHWSRIFSLRKRVHFSINTIILSHVLCASWTCTLAINNIFCTLKWYLATASFLNDLISRTHQLFYVFQDSNRDLKPPLLVPSLETCLSVLFLFPFNFDCKFVQPIMPRVLWKWTLYYLKTNTKFQTSFSSNAPQSFLQSKYTFLYVVLNKSYIFCIL